MHSVRVEHAKLMLEGTRITYQVTVDPGISTPLTGRLLFIFTYYILNHNQRVLKCLAIRT